MKTISQENNFIYLFAALVFLLFSMALLQYIQTDFFTILVELISFGVLLLGVHSLKADRSWLVSVYVMVGLMLLVFLSKKLLNNPTLVEFTNLTILLIFFTGSFLLSFKQILMSKKITQNMIIGSIVLFLLLGLIWSTLYLLLLMIFPHGFNGLDLLTWQENFSKVTYFSFVTLTTLGYGDISPKNPITQFFVYAEAIIGVFYIAVIVSSLVSARLQSFGEKER